MKTMMKWLAGLVLAGILSIPLAVGAANSNQIELNVLDTKTKSPISGVEYSLYRVADYTEGKVSMETSYNDPKLDPAAMMEKENMAKSAQALEKIVVNKGLTGEKKLISDDAGRMVFTDLEDGIYLIRSTAISKELSEGGYTYSSEAFLAALPSMNKDGEFISSITCQPKGYLEKQEPKTDISVNKVWKDYNDAAQKRPVFIQVTLYKDGKAYETVELKEENNWTYLWKGLDGKAKWDLKEDTKLEDYTCTVTKAGTVFTVTNTLTIPTPPPRMYKAGNIIILKKVTKGGKSKNVSDRFWFCLFKDENCSEAASDVIEIELKNASEGTKAFTNLAYGTYYIAETDKDGKPVGSDFAYEVLISQKQVEVGDENQEIEVTIVNNETETPPGNPGGPTGGSRTSVKTGDDTPILGYLALLGAAIVLIIAIIWLRRRKKRHLSSL